MPKSRLVGLLFESWNDFDGALDGVTEDEALERHFGSSSFAWTYAHVTNQVDAWVNVRFGAREPHPLIGHNRYRFGGSGNSGEWEAIQQGVREVRKVASDYLEGKSDENLEIMVPYDGSLEYLRQSGLSLRYTLYRAITHHFFHLGEVASKRDMLGRSVGDYPGRLTDAI